MPVMRLLTGSVAALALASAAATVAGASGDDKQDKSFQRNFPSSRAAPAPATPPQAAATNSSTSSSRPRGLTRAVATRNLRPDAVESETDRRLREQIAALRADNRVVEGMWSLRPDDLAARGGGDIHGTQWNVGLGPRSTSDLASSLSVLTIRNLTDAAMSMARGSPNAPDLPAAEQMDMVIQRQPLLASGLVILPTEEQLAAIFAFNAEFERRIGAVISTNGEVNPDDVFNALTTAQQDELRQYVVENGLARKDAADRMEASQLALLELRRDEQDRGEGSFAGEEPRARSNNNDDDDGSAEDYSDDPPPPPDDDGSDAGNNDDNNDDDGEPDDPRGKEPVRRRGGENR